MPNELQRRIGIPGVDRAPWGEHLCVYFDTKAELLSLVVPFVKAGLEDNEYCIWITGDPINENQAFEALEEVLPHAHHFLARKQLEMLSSTQWYLPSGSFDMEIVLHNWSLRARRAEAEGFDGIRITGNPVWLRSPDDWAQFARYEETVQQQIRNEKAVVLCTYPTWICPGQNVLQTLYAHTSALVHENDQWRRLGLR
jgi:hypothetical protein